MGLFDKRTPDMHTKDSLIEEIYGKLTEQEIAELEQDAEKLEAYENMRRRVRRKKLLRVLGTVMLLFVLTLAVAVTAYKVLFLISDIEVVGDSPYTDEEICAGAGVTIGDGLYSFSSVRAEERLIAQLPYIAELDVDRHIPNRITFTVKYETPVYYTEIYGKIYLMSESLRVLAESSEAEIAETEGLTWLRLPGVREAEFGKAPVLRDESIQKNLEKITATVETSVLNGRIDQIDLRNTFELKMVCDGKYLLYMGEYAEVETKLKIAEAVLRDEMFNNENKARLDLSELSETTVLIDNKLDFTK